MRRRIRTATLVAIVATLAAIGVPVSVARAAASTPPVQGTGVFSCSSVVGHISFNPPLVANGNAPETVKIRLTARGCSGGSPTPLTVRGTASLSFPYNSCESRETSFNNDGTLTYGRKILPSDWFGIDSLYADAEGNPVVQNDDANEVTGSYYSDAFTEPPTGAIWRFYPNWKSTNQCFGNKGVRGAGFSSGVFNDF